MVRALALRCAMRRWPKKSSSNVANEGKQACSSWLPLLSPSEALVAGRCDREQLRDSAQVPVRVGDLHVPEIGREGGDLTADVCALLIPAEQSRDGKGVPQVTDPR